MHTLYTIGYCKFMPDNFVRIMHEFDIKAVVDVRATPFSRAFPGYNGPVFKKFLQANSIYYLSFAEEFGGRPKDPGLYSEGKLDFEKFVAAESFIKGCERLKEGLEKFNVCLMCAQKDPIICHRAIIIAHQFRLLYPNVKIMHITPEGLESQENLDSRVLKKSRINQNPSLLQDDGQDKLDLIRAYNSQIEKTCI